MLRAPRANTRFDLAWRLLAPLLAIALVLSAGFVAPDAAVAGIEEAGPGPREAACPKGP